MQVNSELFPVVADNGDNHVVLGYVAVVLALEASDTVMELLEGVSTVLLNPAGIHEALRVVDHLVGAMFFLREDRDNVREALVRVGVVG